MHRNSSGMIIAAAAATALLAAPAAALASGSVVAGPIKVKGYALTISATDGASDSLSVTAIKRTGASQQMHSWSFAGAKVTIKGSNATIKGSLGRYGSINAKVKGAGKVEGIVPAGCKGTAGSAARGTLTGKTKLVLDSTFFETVAPKQVRAQVIKAGKLDCTTAGGGGTESHGLMLMSTLQDAAGTLSVSVNRVGARVTQTVMRTDAGTAPATVFHMISATTGASGLNAAPDLQNASAPAAGPFLTGQLAFAGTAMGTMATGTMSGDFAAKFDSIGTQSLPEGADGMLMQR